MEKIEKEHLKLELSKRFLKNDKESKQLLDEACLEIDKLNGSFLTKASALTHIPYELAMLVILNLKYFQQDFIDMLNSFHYQDFEDDTKVKDENNVTKFDIRLTSQKLKDCKLYINDRLLTIGEIENLIKLYIEQEKETTTLEDVVAGKYKGKSKKIKTLYKAYKYLTNKENKAINEEIMIKMIKPWLKVLTLYLSNCNEKREV